jgi:hypothetical protein
MLLPCVRNKFKGSKTPLLPPRGRKVCAWVGFHRSSGRTRREMMVKPTNFILWKLSPVAC